MVQIVKYNNKQPKIRSLFCAPNATLIEEVNLEEKASV